MLKPVIGLLTIGVNYRRLTSQQQQRDQNDKQYIDVPINDQLKDVGVTKFVRHSDLVQIVLNDNQVIYFNIHPKQLQQTMERFRESARNGTAGLSNDIIDKMERILVNPNNDYATNYLRLLDDGAEKEQQEQPPPHCRLCNKKNIRRLIIIENERAIGIITAKDLFKVIMNNQNLIHGLLDDKVLVGQKSATHDQFGQYWFSDIFHKVNVIY
jgi:CBS domain-containing protein